MTRWSGPRCDHGREFCLECHGNHQPLKPMPGGPAEKIQQLEQRIQELEGQTMTEEIKGMTPTANGQYAIMTDPDHPDYGWCYSKHPDGMWVTMRVSTAGELQAALRSAEATKRAKPMLTLEMLTAFLQEEAGDHSFSITADSFTCTGAGIVITYTHITSDGPKTAYRGVAMLDLLAFVWSKTHHDL